MKFWWLLAAVLFLAVCLVAGLIARPVLLPMPQWSPDQYAALSEDEFYRWEPAQAKIDFKAPDLGLLAAAVFFETNAQRRSAGQKALAWSSKLARVALAQAREMVQLGYFSHLSPTPGRRTLADRLAAEGLIQGYHGENLAKGFGLQYQPDRPVLGPSVTGGDFKYSLLEPGIAPHTYLSAAKALVAQWLSSPAHRQNILDSRYEWLGCAVVPYQAAEYEKMDFLMAVQDFSSYVENN